MLWHVASSVFSVPERHHFSLPFLVATLPPGGLDATLDFAILLSKSSVLSSLSIEVSNFPYFYGR